MTLFEIITQLENTSSIKDKQAILEANKDNTLLHTYLCLSTDPSIRFFITAKTYPKEAVGIEDGRELLECTLEACAKELYTRNVSGNNAIEFIKDFTSVLNKNDAELIRRMVLKNTKTKVGETLINKVWPKSIFVLPYMRCSLPKEVKMDKIDWKKGVFSQEKSDGMYFDASLNEGGLARASTGCVEVRTRAGTLFTANMLGEKLWNVFLKLPLHTHLQGELIVVDNETNETLSRKVGNGLLNSALANDEPLPDDVHVEARVWDIVEEGYESIPYVKRLGSLFDFQDWLVFGDCVKVVDTKILYSWEDAMNHFYQMRRNGKEGTVLKLPENPWIDGTSKGQIKVKAEVEVELRAHALVQGNQDGKHANTFGSVQFKSECEKVVVDVSGFSDKERLDVFENWDTKYKGAIATICFSEIIDSKSKETYSLYLPRHMEWRWDKNEADDLSRIQTTFESVTKGA